MSLKSLRWCIIVPVFSMLFLPAAASAQSNDAEAEKAIREQIEKFNSSYKEDNGPELVAEVLSDTAFTYAQSRVSEAGPVARIMNKTAYIEAFKKYIWKKNLRKHEHRVDVLTVLGGLAYEFGTVIDVTEDGYEQQAEIFNVFAKEETGWKMVFSTSPDFFRGRTTTGGAEAEAVRAAARKFVATFNSKDPTPVAEFEELLAGDVIAVQSDGTMLQGRSEVVAYYREHLDRLRESLRNVEISWKAMDVKMLGGGAAVFGKLLIQGERKEGGEKLLQEEWETLIFRKEASGWKLTEEQSSACKPAPKEP